MPSASISITVYPDVRLTCPACLSDMPYRTTNETAAGRTIQVPLRYCDACQRKTLAELRAANDATKAATVHANAFAVIFDSIRKSRGA